MTVIKSSIFIFLLVFLQSCQDSHIEPPPDLLSDSTLVNVITDAFILQSAFRQTFGDVRDSMSAVYAQQLLTKWDITKEQYDKNMQWLSRHPEKLDSIYARILQRAGSLEDKISRASANLTD